MTEMGLGHEVHVLFLCFLFLLVKELEKNLYVMYDQAMLTGREGGLICITEVKSALVEGESGSEMKYRT